ncbi:MAG TPA: Fe-S cluster assembly protein SufD [Phenylobacterium sp.]|uniref:Fe-S cluster assembly protein SufD n=1 Tax=Phenylobacterium sp. TaxID=1871053 RepID=UPI002C4AC924|nr:Fe-S cluster assembly protein SufD [Phenylobacterium sp.]HSV04659.1 Fe-S cluster assembly protein SufD [Phenylobacterium sp.]
MSLAAAIRTRDAAALPSRREEDWRWTDLRGLIRAVPEPSAPVDPREVGQGAFDHLAETSFVVANGYEPARIEVAAGQAAIVSLRFLSRGEGAHAARAEVRLGEGARLRLLETYEGRGGYLAAASLAIGLARGAVLERIVLAGDDPEAVSVSQAEVTLAPAAEFGQVVAASGARRQRIETRVVHPGGGAKLRLDGVYLLDGKRHADLTTVVEHRGVDGITMQMTKGVVRDQARGVFQGRIVVAEGADRTDARMEHHALILGDRAEVDAKPELEIYADDVACSHGNSIGALDQEALFYARQRGIPEPDARALLTEAFIGEVVDRIRFESAREIVRQWAAERLRRG